MGTLPLMAEPTPGDLFREYTFTSSTGDAGGAIRVGGKKGVSYPDRGSDHDYVNTPIRFPHEVDLKHAIKAEVVVEKILSHNGTHGLAIQFNDGDWIELPSPESIPRPRRDYYHHACITVPISLDQLHADDSNRFRLRVDPEQGWNWPQHLVYGVHLRIYYDSLQLSPVTATITTSDQESTKNELIPLSIRLQDRPRRINRVEYVAQYEDVNWPGDGKYRRWQYFYYHGHLIHHLGTAINWPYQIQWDTSWVPDQTQKIEVAARVIDDTGLIYMTPALSDLTLRRDGYSVELCKPIDTPDNWVTRNKSYQQRLVIRGDLQQATSAILCWSSWSPGYMNGVSINGHQVIDKEGPKYRYFDHRVPIEDLTILKQGENTIETGKTPLHDGKMVHGMEVNWPGMQLLIRYRN